MIDNKVKKILDDREIKSCLGAVELALETHRRYEQGLLNEDFVGRARVALQNSKGSHTQTFYEYLYMTEPDALRYFYPGFTGKPLPKKKIKEG